MSHGPSQFNPDSRLERVVWKVTFNLGLGLEAIRYHWKAALFGLAIGFTALTYWLTG